ncbi:hypothetical protein [Amycolatopsis granulosa]|nr:hypothetical protein [Amycolatopsis granulosa]
MVATEAVPVERVRLAKDQMHVNHLFTAEPGGHR